MLDTLAYADYAQHLNTKFRLQLPPDGNLEIELIQATEFNAGPQQERFSLAFLAPLDAPVAQGLYQVEHERLGTGALFLVPISRDEKGLCYEAVFNRWREGKKE